MIMMAAAMAFVTIPQAYGKTYIVPDEFSFQYPNNWKLEGKENRFSSSDASLTYGKGLTVQVNFEGIKSEDPSGIMVGQSDDLMVEAMEHAFGKIYDATPYESGADKYIVNNHTAPYALGTYTVPALFGKDIDMVAMVAAVHVNDDETVLFSYLAEQNDFDKYLPKVEKVMQSITPTQVSLEKEQTYQQCLDDNNTTLEQCQARYPSAAAEADKNLTAEDRETRQKALDMLDRLKQLE
jgi:hypothetical protein